MKEQILAYLQSDKHNYHPFSRLNFKFGECANVLLELVSEGKVIQRKGVNQFIYKAVCQVN